MIFYSIDLTVRADGKSGSRGDNNVQFVQKREIIPNVLHAFCFDKRLALWTGKAFWRFCVHSQHGILRVLKVVQIFYGLLRHEEQ